MAVSLPFLNANQQRRLQTHLRLLADDLDALTQLPELARPGSPYAKVRELAAAVQATVDETRRALALPPDRSPALSRRVAAVAGVWAARVDDLRARRLTSSGAVHPDQLASNVAAADLALGAEVLAELDAVTEDPREYWAARSARSWS